MRVQDILTEKINTDVRFEYSEDIQGDDNRGWQVDEVKAYLGGDEVGYLKIAYIPAERFKKWYPSILNYIQQIDGNSIFPYKYRGLDWKKIPVDVLQQSVYSMAQAAHVGWDESNRLQQEAKDAPGHWIFDLYSKLEKQIEKEKGPRMRRFKKYFVNNPYVDFIQVDYHYRNQGIGTALYRAGHAWMKSKGMKLHASGTQTSDAKRAWQSLERNYPVEKIKVGHPTSRGMVTRQRFAD